jgi:hypothetical protein
VQNVQHDDSEFLRQTLHHGSLALAIRLVENCEGSAL